MRRSAASPARRRRSAAPWPSSRWRSRCRLPDPWSTLSLLQLLPLALVQRAASAAALAAVPGADPNTRLTPINWVGIAFGVMILLLTALAATLPPPAPAKPAPTATTQAALTPDAGRTTRPADQAAPTIRSA